MAKQYLLEILSMVGMKNTSVAITTAIAPGGAQVSIAKITWISISVDGTNKIQCQGYVQNRWLSQALIERPA
jgi:hypothetical protein